jgi:phage host-nuclease inhibitor protein Gam
MESEMDKEILRIKEKYDNACKDERLEINLLENDIELFAIENKDEFEKVRSKELNFGTVGFRFSPPKVSLLNRKYNWKTVNELAKKICGKKYIREKPELNKEQILTDSTGKKKSLTDEQLASIGLKIDSNDNFYYELKLEKIIEKKDSNIIQLQA